MIKSWQPINNSLLLFFSFYICIYLFFISLRALQLLLYWVNRSYRVSKCAHVFDLIVWIAPWEDTSINKTAKKQKQFALLLHLWVKIICCFFIYYTGNEIFFLYRIRVWGPLPFFPLYIVHSPANERAREYAIRNDIWIERNGICWNFNCVLFGNEMKFKCQRLYW